MGQYKSSENYLKAICQAHPDVAHGQLVDGVARNSFFRINEEEELTEAVIENIHYPCVGYINISGRLKDKDNQLIKIKHQFSNAWIFLQNINRNVEPDGVGSADKIQDAYDTTFGIMEDFIKAMKDEYEENGRCGIFDDLDLNTFNYAQTGLVQESAYGWILYFDAQFSANRIIDGTTINWQTPQSVIEPEIIFIDNEASKVVSWTNIRRTKYGLFPTVQVYLRDAKNVLYLAAVQPVPDAPPPAFTQLNFTFPAAVNGFIVIK